MGAAFQLNGQRRSSSQSDLGGKCIPARDQRSATSKESLATHIESIAARFRDGFQSVALCPFSRSAKGVSRDKERYAYSQIALHWAVALLVIEQFSTSAAITRTHAYRPLVKPADPFDLTCTRSIWALACLSLCSSLCGFCCAWRGARRNGCSRFPCGDGGDHAAAGIRLYLNAVPGLTPSRLNTIPAGQKPVNDA
jgi:hypothetical protein